MPVIVVRFSCVPAPRMIMFFNTRKKFAGYCKGTAQDAVCSWVLDRCYNSTWYYLGCRDVGEVVFIQTGYVNFVFLILRCAHFWNHLTQVFRCPKATYAAGFWRRYPESDCICVHKQGIICVMSFGNGTCNCCFVLYNVFCHPHDSRICNLKPASLYTLYHSMQSKIEHAVTHFLAAYVRIQK